MVKVIISSKTTKGKLSVFRGILNRINLWELGPSRGKSRKIVIKYQETFFLKEISVEPKLTSITGIKTDIMGKLMSKIG